MKLLVDHDLAALNAFLSCVNVGDYVVSGQAESYSCTSRHSFAMMRRAREWEYSFIHSFWIACVGLMSLDVSTTCSRRTDDFTSRAFIINR